jgi:hypothetical protein
MKRIFSSQLDRKADESSFAIDPMMGRVVLAFWIAIGLLISLQAGRLLEPLFPLSAVSVGLYLYGRSPAAYVSFVWWIWFTGPVIRRIIDYQVGGYTFGPWTLTPMLVISICALRFFRTLPKAYRGASFPIVLSAFAMIYGGSISFHLPSRIIILGLLSALSPIIFAYYLVMNWREHPAIQAATQKAFLWGTIFMGGYGIYQFLVAPAWDTFYMTSEFGNSAFGLPEPFKIRVFGSMTSPYSIATAMISGILILLTNKSPLRWLAFSLSSLTLMLTLARGVWFSCIIALFTAIIMSRFRYKIRLVITIVVVGLILAGLASSELFQETIITRINSLSDGEGDASFNARKQAFDAAWKIVIFEIIGKGFIGSEIIGDTGVPMGDNGIFYILSSLGWIGCIPYFTGIILSLLVILKTYARNGDPWLVVCFSLPIGALAQIGFVDITGDVSALVLWSFIGSGIASSLHDTSCSKHLDST